MLPTSGLAALEPWISAMVTARLREFESLGFDLIVCRSQFGNLPRDLLRRAIEGLGRVRAEVST